MKTKMKKPEACKDILEVRKCIDSIDQKIITLLGLRLKYVLIASKFKKNLEWINAKTRRERMIKQRIALAKKKELDPTMIKEIYRILLTYFAKEQLFKWKLENKKRNRRTK